MNKYIERVFFCSLVVKFCSFLLILFDSLTFNPIVRLSAYTYDPHRERERVKKRSCTAFGGWISSDSFQGKGRRLSRRVCALVSSSVLVQLAAPYVFHCVMGMSTDRFAIETPLHSNDFSAPLANPELKKTNETLFSRSRQREIRLCTILK